MITYKTYENNIIYSISEIVMHHFRKSEILFLSLKICVFQCPVGMWYLAPVTYPSQIYLFFLHRANIASTKHKWVCSSVTEKLDHATYFSNAPRMRAPYTE